MQPFNCSSFAILISGGVTRLDLFTGESSPLGSFPFAEAVNGFGYSQIDGLMYGYGQTSDRIVRFGSDLDLEILPPTLNLPVADYNVGDVDANGYLYLAFSGNTTFYVIDVNPSRATYGQLVNPSTKVLTTTGTTYTGSLGTATLGTGDWAFNPIDGQLYYANISDGIVRKMNPLTGFITALTTVTPLPAVYGSAFSDSLGNLYSIDNTSGNVYKFGISGLTATRSFFSNSTSVGGDGGRCPLAPIGFASLEDPIPKFADLQVGVNETITYTLLLNNIGNTVATDVILIDTIPESTTFVPNSVFLDEINIPGSPDTPGLTLGDLSVGAHTLTFSVLANSVLPVTNPIENFASATFNFVDIFTSLPYSKGANSISAFTTIVDSNIITLKYVDSNYAEFNDILTYTIVLTNLGNTEALSVFLLDTLPVGSNFISGSLLQDGSPLADPELLVSFTLPSSLLPNETTTLSFQVSVDTLPAENPITNNSTIFSNYIGNPSLPSIIERGISSNTVVTTINSVDLSSIVKYVDKNFMLPSDEVQYTIVVPNNGTTLAQNLIFHDTLSAGLTLVSNSLFINGILYPDTDLSLGITLPNLDPNNVLTIVFNAKLV